MTQYYTRPKLVHAWQYDPGISEGTVCVPRWVLGAVFRGDIYADDSKNLCVKQGFRLGSRIVDKDDWIVEHENMQLTAHTPAQFETLYRLPNDNS